MGRRIAIGLLLAAVVAGAGWLALWLLWRHWAPIFFYFYLATALFLGVISLIYARMSRGARDVIADVFSPAPWWRRALESVLVPLSAALSWPAITLNTLLQLRKKAKELFEGGVHRLQAGAAGILYPADVTLALTALGLVLTTYLLSFYLPVSPTYSVRIMALIFLQVIVRHLVYALGRMPLPMRLRRSSGNAYAKFSVLVVCDFLTLVLATAGLFRWTGRGLPSIAVLQEVALDLVRFQKMRDAFAGKSISFADIVITGAGALYYFILLNTALRLKEFRRNDQDFLAIADSYLMLGRYNEASKYLARIEAPSVSSHRSKALMYLGVNQVDRAWNSMRRAEQLEREGLSDLVYDQRVLASLVGGFMTPLTPLHAKEVVLKAVASSISDFFLCVTLFGMLGITNFDTTGWEELIDPDSYPLTLSCLLVSRQEFSQATAVLSALKTSTPEAETLRRMLLLRASITPTTTLEQDRQTIETWCAENLSVIAREIPRVSEELLKVPLIGMLRSLKVMAEQCGSSRVEEIAFLTDELSVSIGAEGHRLDDISERLIRAMSH